MKTQKITFVYHVFALTSFMFSLSLRAETSFQRNSIYVHSESQGEMVSAVPEAGMVTNNNSNTPSFEIRIVNSCFATNLRTAGNPLSPYSTITAKLSVTVGVNTYDVNVDYPAHVVTPEGMTQAAPVTNMSPGKITGTAGTTAAIFGNVVKISVPGSLPPPGSRSAIDASFIQKVNDCSYSSYGTSGMSAFTPTKACGEYMGQDGPLAAEIQNLGISSDNKSFEIKVSFPGETGFCGGYYSPLMLFFDEARPGFSGQSQFPLIEGRSVTWPEANSPGYFLVYDERDKLVVNKSSQLFGESKDFKNGFDKLIQLDANHDGVISAKDPAFKHLYLWNNRKGDGISQKQDLIPLGKMVEKISLKYQRGHLRPIGQFAEEREKSIFWFKDKKGILKQGQIVDIWLSPK